MADLDWADALVGKSLAGRYAVESVLGSGGMGVVLKATHLRLDRPVAIKMVQPLLSQDATIIARFHQEARAAASVGSAGVVEVIDLDEDPEHGPFLVMELLRGESFVEILQRGSVETERAVWIVTELLDVLGAVHAKGIIHRDLKPPNVFLHQDEAGDEVVKVLDFGIAKVSQRHLTMTGQIVGTPRFMAPEQALGEELDARCDLYAAGLLLYCALTGLPPYATVPNHKLIEAVNQGPPSLRTLRPDLPEALLQVVDQALQKDPNDRFVDAASMADALRGAMNDAREPGRDVPQRAPVEPADTVESTRPPVFASAPTAPAGSVAAAGPVSGHGDEESQGSESTDEELVVPERHGWRWAIALLSVGALATGGFIATQSLRAPSARVSLEVEGSCEVPRGEVPVTLGAEGLHFGESDGPRLLLRAMGNRYWVAAGTSAQGASAEALSGTGPGRVRVRALEVDQIDVTFTRVQLVSSDGPCIISGEIRSE